MVCKKCSAALSPGFCRINRQAQKAFAVNAVLRQFFINKMPQKKRLTSGQGIKITQNIGRYLGSSSDISQPASLWGISRYVS